MTTKKGNTAGRERGAERNGKVTTPRCIRRSLDHLPVTKLPSSNNDDATTAMSDEAENEVSTGLCCNGVTITEVTEVTAHLGIFNLT